MGINENLQKLLYGPADISQADGSVEDVKHNDHKKDKQFAHYGQFKMGKLGKKMTEQTAKDCPSGPELETVDAGEFEPRAMRSYEECPEYFDNVVNQVLDSIKASNEFAELYLGFGKASLTGKQRRILVVQALQYVGNDVMNDACSKNHYLNTIEHLDDEVSAIAQHSHETYERTRKEKWDEIVRSAQAFTTAKRIAATTDMDAFVGRLIVSCPTRGGLVFDKLIGVMCEGRLAGEMISSVAEKIEVIMTGKWDGEEVMSAGSSWALCPIDTAKRLRDVAGEDAFGQIELKIHGHSGWVYRESDIPNRHGHCNSNPNHMLTTTFKGFKGFLTKV